MPSCTENQFANIKRREENGYEIFLEKLHTISSHLVNIKVLFYCFVIKIQKWKGMTLCNIIIAYVFN